MVKLLVRVSDNVLDDGDWPVRRIEIEGDRIVGVENLHAGVYGFDHMPDVGWTLDQLVQWAARDCTGRHPENYYEVKAQTDDDYPAWVGTLDQLQEIIQRAKRVA